MLPECVSHADGRHRRQPYDHFFLSELRVCLLAHGARLFTLHYDHPIVEDGKVLKDMYYFSRTLAQPNETDG